jgi:hypothetical protein
VDQITHLHKVSRLRTSGALIVLPIRLCDVLIQRKKFILRFISQNVPLYENKNRRASAVLRVTEF